MTVRFGLRSAILAVRLALLGVLLLTTSLATHAQGGLVSWWPGNGNYKDVVSGNDGTPYGGVGFAPGVYGEGFSFTGNDGRIFVPDVPSLAITGSMAITAWIKLSAYPGQFTYILFRGDNRNGYDPYWLGVGPGGHPIFQISDGSNNQVLLYGDKPLPLERWVFVAGTLDASGFDALMDLDANGSVLDFAFTSVRPYATLDASESPGVGIGNTQSSLDNQMFPGIIDDLKIYNTAYPQITPVKLRLSQSSVKGGSKINATLTLNDSPITPVSASVSSTVAAATVPASVTVAAGHYSVGFVIKTETVTSTQSGNISVTLNGITLTAGLTITP